MQQINLYKAQFQPNRDPLRSIHILSGMVVLVLLLIFLSVYKTRAIHTLQLQVASDQLVLATSKAELAELLVQNPKNDLALFDAKILGLTDDFNKRQEIFEVISNKDLGNNTGFSLQLAALGRQSMASVSLRAFSLQKGGNYVELLGTTRSADQVPLYIQQLRTEPAFAGVGFGVLNVVPQSANKSIYQFSLAEMLDAKALKLRDKTLVQSLLEASEKAEEVRQ